jgi:hypothetical protein
MAKRQVQKTVSKATRTHSVTATVRNCELAKAKSAIKLVILAKAYKLGELEIGRGGLYWWGHKRHKSKRISWSEFSDMMNEKAYGSRV